MTLSPLGWRSDDMYRKGEIRLTDIAKLLGSEWPALAAELELTEEEVTKLMDEYGQNAALHMLRYWLKSRGTDATGNASATRICPDIRNIRAFQPSGNCLQQALRKIGKENIVNNCVFNIEWVTDAAEKEVAKARLTSRGGSIEGSAVGGRRVSDHRLHPARSALVPSTSQLDEGFESDEEYERRRYGRSSEYPARTPLLSSGKIGERYTLCFLCPL